MLLGQESGQGPEQLVFGNVHAVQQVHAHIDIELFVDEISLERGLLLLCPAADGDEQKSG